jgi:hypothetical protein
MTQNVQRPMVKLIQGVAIEVLEAKKATRVDAKDMPAASLAEALDQHGHAIVRRKGDAPANRFRETAGRADQA